MVSGAYLRQQAEVLIALSRATFDLSIAGRLREMASELRTKAAEQESRTRVLTPTKFANFKRQVGDFAAHMNLSVRREQPRRIRRSIF